MRIPVLVLGCVLVSGWAMGESTLELSDLFTAGEGGYALYRIPGIVVTAKGTVIAYCEARRSAEGDWGETDVLMRRSLDGGDTWEPAREVVAAPSDVPVNPVAVAQNLDSEGEATVNNPVAIADYESGAVHFLFCMEYSRCYYTRSDDDGVTFSDPVDITATFDAFRPEYDWKVLATGPGHGIRLTSGRLLVPVWLSTGTGGHAHRPSVNSTIYSDDNGKTWLRGEVVAGPPELENPSETVAVELADGRVMLNIRHESGVKDRSKRFRAVSISADGATGWTPFRFDEQLPEPVCMGSILALPQRAGDETARILFANPHNERSRVRRNLAVKMSEDQAQTWGVMRVLDADISGYSDLAAGEDGTIYCFYERGRVGKTHFTTAHLCVARFNLEWIMEKADG